MCVKQQELVRSKNGDTPKCIAIFNEGGDSEWLINYL